MHFSYFSGYLIIKGEMSREFTLMGYSVQIDIQIILIPLKFTKKHPWCILLIIDSSLSFYTNQNFRKVRYRDFLKPTVHVDSENT